MYQPTASTASNHPYSNGHLSPPLTKSTANGAITPDSESDLSEAIDIPVVPTTLSYNKNDAREDSRTEGSDAESSHDEDALGSDDPDYTMATPPPGDNTPSRDGCSSSQDSPRQRKRKAGMEPGDYMLHDPELYGLRRSVGQSTSSLEFR